MKKKDGLNRYTFEHAFTSYVSFTRVKLVLYVEKKSHPKTGNVRSYVYQSWRKSKPLNFCVLHTYSIPRFTGGSR